MISAQAFDQHGLLSDDLLYSTLNSGLEGKFTGARLLVLIPDHTRSLPLPKLFRMLTRILSDTKSLDVMVALGTHPPLYENSMNQLVGITSAERESEFRHVRLLNHAWQNPKALVTLGRMEQDEIQQIAGNHWHKSLPSYVDIQINKAVQDVDHILILGPTFPHEVVGFSGGAKYLFPGISGPEMINATHWLGALASVVGTIGIKDTPVRDMIHAAAARLSTPVTLIALTVVGHDLCGMTIGDAIDAWSQAAENSAKVHIQWYNRPFKRVLSWAPPMYDELWTAAKAMYKVEPVTAPGSEVIIYAPHLSVISEVHGKYIKEVGYHTLPYILEHWDELKHIPLGVLAHSSHVRGFGKMENGVEKANVSVVLASKVPREDCERLNLGYLDPERVDLKEWQHREEEGLLFVPRAGEILYKLK